jgi:hypothetical protein
MLPREEAMNYATTFRKVILIAIVCVSGCVSKIPPEPAFFNNPGLHIQHDTAVSMNWLAIAGGVTIALGVAAFMSGQKAAVNIIAGGGTLLAVGIIVSQALSFLAEYRAYFFALMCFLALLFFFLHTGNLLDVNRDGKVDLNDLKCIFLKFRRKPKTT